MSAQRPTISPSPTTLNDAAPHRGEPVPAWPMLVQLVCADDLTIPPRRIDLPSDLPWEPGMHIVLGREDRDGRSPGRVRIALADRYVSLQHAYLEAAPRGWRLGDAGSTNGTWLDGRRLRGGELAALPDGAVIEVGHTFFVFRLATPSGEPGPTDNEGDGDAPTTLCPEWHAQLATLDRLARSPHPVLIEGESGVGKERIARALHDRSGRPGALVSLNCAALPDNLLEDELFGHVRGAFSGALTSRDGLIRAAHQGTLFLDEIGDMPATLQVRLLRVLEDHKVRPLGGDTEIAIDLRVIAATHRDLRALAAAGSFRHDLLARLGLLPFRVPPLRERREDLGLLIRALLAAPPNALDRVRFHVAALRRLVQHDWPLNVRELRAALLAAADLARGDDGVALIGTAHLPASLGPAPRTTPPPRAPLPPGDAALRDRIVQLLAAHRGNVAAVARALDSKRTNVQRAMARLGIDRSSAISNDGEADASPDSAQRCGSLKQM